MSCYPSLQTQTHALKCELASNVLRSYGRLNLKVTGWSMLPVIWPGDTLELQRTNHHELSTGDIALFSGYRRLFAHRIVQRSGRSIHTRGDALPYPDPVLAENELLGRVACIVRDGRQIQPGRNLSFSQRAVAGLVRSSDIAARVVVGIHGFARKTKRVNLKDRSGVSCLNRSPKSSASA